MGRFFFLQGTVQVLRNALGGEGCWRHNVFLKRFLFWSFSVGLSRRVVCVFSKRTPKKPFFWSLLIYIVVSLRWLRISSNIIDFLYNCPWAYCVGSSLNSLFVCLLSVRLSVCPCQDQFWAKNYPKALEHGTIRVKKHVRLGHFAESTRVRDSSNVPLVHFMIESCDWRCLRHSWCNDANFESPYAIGPRATHALRV